MTERYLIEMGMMTPAGFGSTTLVLKTDSLDEAIEFVEDITLKDFEGRPNVQKLSFIEKVAYDTENHEIVACFQKTYIECLEESWANEEDEEY